MATELQTTTQALTAFDITAERIEQLAAESFALKIKGIGDKRGLAKIQRARIEWQTALREVERKRRELKAPLLEEIDKIDGAAWQIRGWIEPAESYLRSLVEADTAERLRREREAAETRVATIRRRLGLLAEVGWTHYTPADVGPLSEDDYDKLLQHARANPRPVGAAAARVAAKLEPLAKASQAEDMAKLMHVANLVALIEVPQVMTQAAEPWAREIETLLANCVDRIRAAANLVAK